ncbi:uncharacterized protein LOC128558741 [Mercenaria mercenaria]|uniref:uncharacterized protein LOC128558741 n=1 Tax=Mercenaria mercenaria TaxID=6596 RepID=UPI00234E8EC9|nr:uncharacterized protein LOC128558741 [Mercenaria mercenaria]
MESDGLDLILSQVADDAERNYYELLDNSSENVFLSQIPLEPDNMFESDVSFDLGSDFLTDPVKSDLETNVQTKSEIKQQMSKPEKNNCDNFSNLNDERFGKPATDEEIQELMSSRRNKNTAKNTKWAVNIFDTWRKYRHFDNIPEIHTMEKSVLSYWLTCFVMEIKKSKRGKLSTENTLPNHVWTIETFA